MTDRTYHAIFSIYLFKLPTQINFSTRAQLTADGIKGKSNNSYHKDRND